ncbi:MAG: hypothetical protein F6K19_05330 [Cyanothece sp. SIO1E1]|nr:hypothetical protein [Cyanothece sp. SIO1E1]
MKVVWLLFWAPLLSVVPTGVAAPDDSNLRTDCNRLNGVVNQVTGELSTVFSHRADAAELFSQVVAITEKAVLSFEAIQLVDSQLQNYSNRFTTLYTNVGNASRDLVDAERAQDQAAAQSAYDAFRSAVRPEGILINEMKRYCSH